MSLVALVQQLALSQRLLVWEHTLVLFDLQEIVDGGEPVGALLSLDAAL